MTSPKCICGEINARHCPVHNQPKVDIDAAVDLAKDVIAQCELHHVKNSYHDLECEYAAAFLALKEENERLNEDIKALTHEGRQGELELANVGLAQENETLRAKLEQATADNEFRLSAENKQLKEENEALRGELGLQQEHYSQKLKEYGTTHAQLVSENEKLRAHIELLKALDAKEGG